MVVDRGFRDLSPVLREVIQESQEDDKYPDVLNTRD